MSRRGLAIAVPLLAAALALPAAASAQGRYGYGPYGSPYRQYTRGGVVDGFVTTGNGACLVLRDHQRRPFYLSGDTAGLEPGDHVALRERMVSRSSCGSDGPTLEVLEIRTVWTGGSHREAYFDARRDGDFDRFLDRNRDRGGWYSDHYANLSRNGDRYGQYAPPNGPNDQGQPPQYGPQYGSPNGQYAPPDDNGQGQPPYEPPNGQYEPNGQDDNGEYGPDATPPDDRNGGEQPISVDGTLDFNQSCPQIHTSNGAYDLAGNLGNFHDGDRVHVDGVLAGTSSCGGTALEVRGIRRR